MQQGRTFRTILAFLYTFYLLAVFYLLFVSNRGGYCGLNLQPFYTINNYLRAWRNDTVNKSIVIRNLGGNFLLFMPMTFCLPLLRTKKRRSLLWVIVTAFLIAAVEALQYLLQVGSCDIDDFILNYAGALIAYPFGLAAAWLCRKLFENGGKRKNENQ